MFKWIKNFFDVGEAAYQKEMSELHDPGHAEKHTTVKKYKSWGEAGDYWDPRSKEAQTGYGTRYVIGKSFGTFYGV